MLKRREPRLFPVAFGPSHHQSNMRPSILFLVAIAIAPAAFPQTALLRTGDPSPSGTPFRNIHSFLGLAVNQSGGYSCLLQSSGSGNGIEFWGSFSAGPGAQLREQGTFGSLTQTTIHEIYGMSQSSLIYGAKSDDGNGQTSFDLEGVWIDDSPFAIAEAPRLGTSSFWTFASDPRATESGVPVYVGGSSTSVGASTQSAGMFLGQSALYETGDVLPNTTIPLRRFAAVSPYSRTSANATRSIAGVYLDTVPWENSAIAVDGAGLLLGGALVKAGNPVPASIGGVAPEEWHRFRFMGITEAGDSFFCATTEDTQAGFSYDEVIVRNGVIAIREGDTVDGQLILGFFKYAALNENNQLAFVCEIAGSGGLRTPALFVDDKMLISQGDDVDWDGDGTIDPGYSLIRFSDSPNSLTIDPNGVAYFLATVVTPTGSEEGYFRMSSRTPIGTNFCAALPNSTGAAGSIGATGSTSIADNDVVLTASNLPAGTFGIFIVSSDPAPMPMPLGAGSLCLSGAIGRYAMPGQVFAVDPGGNGSLTIDISSIPQASQTIAAAPGDSWSFQAWHRDTVGGLPDANLTNGLEISFQ